MGTASEYWLAEAKVVGKLGRHDFYIRNEQWRDFWKDYKLRLRYKGAEYLLCSSITLIKRIA